MSSSAAFEGLIAEIARQTSLNRDIPRDFRLSVAAIPQGLKAKLGRMV
jgi:hypothetical protein